MASSHPVRAIFKGNYIGLQVSRIKDSIINLVKAESLEPIQHFHFPPWNKTTPFSVAISSLSKEEASVAHNLSLGQLGQNDCVIYTDASQMSSEKSIGIGVGLVLLTHETGLLVANYRTMTNLGNSQLVYNGELESVTLAIKYASEIARPN